jgi:hypothetical protein
MEPNNADVCRIQRLSRQPLGSQSLDAGEQAAGNKPV